MTNPVILLGTQSNGETLPVQVDAFGRLVAEGLQGQEGPEGPKGDKGDTGPEGPPGPGIELPPDPYEGALLGWENGGLAWIGTPPVPLPGGVFGPITSWDPENSYLEVAGVIPEGAQYADALWQCDEQGTYYTEGFSAGKPWIEYLNPYPVERPAILAFNGSENDEFYYGADAVGAGTIWNWTPDEPIPYSNRVEIYMGNIEDTKGGINGGSMQSINRRAWNTLASGNGTLASIQMSRSRTFVYSWAALRIDGKILLDQSQSLNLRPSAVVGNGIIGFPSRTDNFTTGKYLYMPQTRVAPWVLYGNDPTSLIDHLRLSRE